MSDATIEVAGLRKRFGPTLALDGMTFTVSPGQVTGFVGPNGAGKTTTIRVILGLDAPDDGRALVGGQSYQHLRHPLRHVGALVDAAALQPSRTARNHLAWLARSQDMAMSRVDEVIEMVGLASAARRKAGGFSLGMRQRLGIAAAMLGDPPVLILDEPFNGMDPEGIIWIRHLLRSLAGKGRTVLVSSHLMSELQDIANRVVVIGDTARGLGALVVMNDQIHAARWAAKTHTASPAAFASPGFGPLGQVIEGRVDIPVLIRERSPHVRPVPGRDVRIGLVTIALGDDGVLADAISEHVDGLVVAALGVGHVPADMVTTLAKVAARMPVVLASRIGAGPVHGQTYSFPGAESDLLARGLISAGYLAPVKARLLLYLLIAGGADMARITATFASADGVTPSGHV
jgi:ABC-type Na+ transport system ATPase subunit NatA